jgi:osmotically-inducible protein OsmY
MHTHINRLCWAFATGLLLSLGACDRYEQTPPAPDNTGRNVRDRDGATQTPIDQGNSASDLDLAARIRKDIVDADLSMNATNAKVIAKDGHVTLRGPVDTASERERVGVIAERHAGAGNVTNELEVTGSE